MHVDGCFICGAPCIDISNDYKELKWLSIIIGIDKDDTITKLKDEDNGKWSISGTKDDFHTYVSEYNNKIIRNPFGIVCHKVCHNLLKSSLNYKVKFSDIYEMYKNPKYMSEKLTYFFKTRPTNYFNKIDYGKIVNYYGNLFHLEKLINDGNQWMISLPLTNKKNSDRIVNIWKNIIPELPSLKKKSNILSGIPNIPNSVLRNFNNNSRNLPFKKINIIPANTNNVKLSFKKKTCPEGKIINPKSGRCINEKKNRKKKTQLLIKKECPEGKFINPKTGRCIKIKKV